jgi:hypothetical protein
MNRRHSGLFTNLAAITMALSTSSCVLGKTNILGSFGRETSVSEYAIGVDLKQEKLPPRDEEGKPGKEPGKSVVGNHTFLGSYWFGLGIYYSDRGVEKKAHPDFSVGIIRGIPVSEVIEYDLIRLSPYLERRIWEYDLSRDGDEDLQIFHASGIGGDFDIMFSSSDYMLGDNVIGGIPGANFALRGYIRNTFGVKFFRTFPVEWTVKVTNEKEFHGYFGGGVEF